MNNNFSYLKKQILNHEFSHLNDMQKTAVFKTEGPLLILAGAGSGKTTVLINRIVNILNFGADNLAIDITDEQSHILQNYIKKPDNHLKPQVLEVFKPYCIKPWEILAITFTNKAAKELKERLEIAVGEGSEHIWANTFHATCSKILRRHADKISYSTDFTIYDEDDKKRILLEIIRSLNLDEKKFDPRAISSQISRAKDSLMSSREFALEAQGNFYKQTIAEIYSLYEKRMFSSNAFDFDDIICKTVMLLDKNPEVLEFYQNKFKYIVVDEYQDTNHAQYKLVHMLADKRKNICVVGDDDQSIYKFRGATITNILEFERDYDNATTIRLEQNYRSTSNILHCANHLIAKNTKRKGKNLWTDKESDKKVTVYRCENQDEEARYIATKIINAKADGANFSDFAILYRNHALSNAVELALKRQGIPYKIFSGLRFFDRAEVRDMIAYLCVINNSTDTHRLKRIINNPPRKIGAKAIEVITYLANEHSTTAYDIITNVKLYEELSRPSNAIFSFYEIIEHLKDCLATMPLDAFYDELLRKSGYLEMLLDKNDVESRGRIENISELKSSIIEYMSRCSEENPPTLSGFLEEISLFTDLDNASEENDMVTMLTIHSSKGLEFNQVFICGLEDGIFPSFKSFEDPLEIEEERRLLYVAITRARKNLTLTCTERRLLYGQTKHYKPSIFLNEIPSEYTDCNISKGQMRMINSERESFAQNLHASSSNLSVSAKSAKAEQIINLSIGDSITHKVFGAGLITSTKPMGGDILLEIAFEKVGTKRLLAKTAQSFITKN